MEDDAPVIYGLEFQVSMAEFEGRCRLRLALTVSALTQSGSKDSGLLGSDLRRGDTHGV